MKSQHVNPVSIQIKKGFFPPFYLQENIVLNCLNNFRNLKLVQIQLEHHHNPLGGQKQ